jgi:tetratricopeptide (TPR) repeat protein
MLSRLLISALVVLGLLGCSSFPRNATSPAGFTSAQELEISDRVELARKLAEKHDLAEALVQWKILRTIDPSNAEYGAQVSALQKTINEEVARHLAAGLANLRQGAYDKARLSFLKVLALDPKRRDVLGHLRGLDEQQMRSNQKKGMPDAAYSKITG